MKVSKTITSEVVLTPEQVTEIIKAHMAKKGLKVTNVQYKLETKHMDYMDECGYEVLSKIIVTQTEKTEQEI